MDVIDEARPGETAARNRSGSAGGFSGELYVLMTAGIATGVIVVGVGSRLAMFVLRVTSPAHVDGMQSDDDFTIGRFTLSGTYNLLLIGAAVGVLGAAAYQWVRPWLLGPRWFRLITVALASGAVVGSMLVHADGVDFTLLEPMWLAVSLFVTLPAAFAFCVAVAVDRVERHVAAGAPSSWRSWVPPVALAAVFPPVLLVLAVASAVLLVWVVCRELPAVRRMAGSSVLGVLARVAWLGLAVIGLVALLGDIADLRAGS